MVWRRRGQRPRLRPGLRSGRGHPGAAGGRAAPGEGAAGRAAAAGGERAPGRGAARGAARGEEPCGLARGEEPRWLARGEKTRAGRGHACAGRGGGRPPSRRPHHARRARHAPRAQRGERDARAAGGREVAGTLRRRPRGQADEGQEHLPGGRGARQRRQDFLVEAERRGAGEGRASAGGRPERRPRGPPRGQGRRDADLPAGRQTRGQEGQLLGGEGAAAEVREGEAGASPAAVPGGARVGQCAARALAGCAPGEPRISRQLRDGPGGDLRRLGAPRRRERLDHQGCGATRFVLPSAIAMPSQATAS